MKTLLACDPAIPHEVLLQQITARLWPASTEFHVIAVVDPDADESSETITTDPVSSLQISRSSLAEEKVSLIAQVLSSSGLHAACVVVDGNPHDEIVREAKTWNADLILVASPQHDDGFPFMHISVAHTLIRHAPCSVQIVRSGPIQKVLVATDGSEYSLKAARSIAARPWSTGTRFEVICVVEQIRNTLAFLYPPHNHSPEAEEAREQAMLKAQIAIKTTELILSAAGLTVSDNLLLPADTPDKLILEEAAEWQADLIVVAPHGEPGLTDFLLGTITENVAMRAVCSVEVVR